MSSLIYGQWKQYFQVPIADRVERLTIHAYRLYGLLCRMMNESSAVVIELTNAEITVRTGITDHKTIKNARRELADARLVELHRGFLGVYSFVMLSESGVPIEPPKGRKGIRHFTFGKSLNPVPPDPLLPPTATTLPGRTVARCYVHRRETEHWEQHGALVCNECHPNPNVPESSAPKSDRAFFRQPTAKELGF
jgi:hypothetical protein